MKDRYERIKAHFDAKDRERLRHGKLPYHDTAQGIWGATHLDDAFELFSRIRLERFSRFADLGCGDGRIAIVAGLFTAAVGIESDPELAAQARAAAAGLGSKACIKQQDYYDEDLSQYDVVFMFADKRFDERILAKLRSEFRGWLFLHGRAFVPHGLRPGKTYWVGQIAFPSYAINVPERNLELDE